MDLLWNCLDDLKALQRQLAAKVRLEPFRGPVKFIGGADVAYVGPWAIGVVVVMKWPDLELVDVGRTIELVSFPYVPGFLSFREVPVLVEAYYATIKRPDLLLVDGQGIAHPRGIGLASHLGVMLDIRTIGCAKEVLVGKARPPARGKGAYSLLVSEGKTIGVLLRTKRDTKPLCVSPGHRIDLESSIRWILESTRGARLPEPLRRAHQFAQLSKAFFLRGEAPNPIAPRRR